jgi:hypothetical protein
MRDDFWGRRIDAEWDYEEVRRGESFRVCAILPIPEGMLSEGEPTEFMSTICYVRVEEIAAHMVEAHNTWRNELVDNP